MSSNNLLLIKASLTVRLPALVYGTQTKRRGTNVSMEYLFNHLFVQSFVFAPVPTSVITIVVLVYMGVAHMACVYGPSRGPCTPN
jgi:hypothetical protein